ncbi:MAG TPA: bifunctional diguanylate cyclase/phosphodiesterase [Steroidobacteraceae bacterium]|nr:bifunctional diguanylate cyclase/phosphodiesterase [Steroidobacteraceae bacterium]
MKLGFQAIRSVGLAAALCAGLVLAAGARLVALSLEQHAVQARSAAQSYADQAAQALQSQLQRLVITARTRAAAASQALATSATPAASGLTTLPTHPDGFWLMNDGRVLGAAGTGRERARAIASRWQPSSPGAAPSPAAASTSAGAPANSNAPVAIQEGTGWLIATRVAVQSSADSGDGSGAVAQPPAWAVVYRDLDDLLVGAHLDRAGRLGYDFSLAQAGPTERVPLPLASTRTEPLSQPARARITLPGGTQAWQLDVRPRSGWFPASDLVVESSLVLLVAWLAALGVADAAKHLSHLRSALEASRERLHNTQRRLSEELEQRERLQRSFDHAHYHDSFTGLPNRRYFLDQVDRALREMRTRSGREIAALLISVGRYKVVTDTLGHTAGDELMVQITRLANQALAGQEFVLARWADDELALLVSAVHSAEGVLHIARLLQQALQTPIEIRRHRIMAATSMGATYVESGLQRAEEVLREADIALSSAKAQGGSRLVSYSSAMQTHLMQQVSLEGDLQQALERQEFRLMFQPIVDLSGRQIVGMEVLLRWLHPVEGLLRPDRFLSSAEEAGLSVAITRWIIQRTCQIGRQWRTMLPSDTQFYFSVNLSTAALLDPELSEYVRQALSRTEVGPAALKFEVTESSLISNVGAARQALDRLHALGVELMLDDFGTGYSSLSHLQLFPFDYIKIDGPFDSRGATTHPTLAGAHHGPDRGTAALVRAMTQMAEALGLKTVAEIVETTSAVNSLQQFGCQFAQGNAFSPPVDADQAFQRLRARILEPHDAIALEEPEPEEDDSATMILPVLPETMIE